MNVDFCGVLAKLGQDYRYVLGVGEHEDELKLCDFDVDGVIIFAEEHSNVAAEHFRSSLEDEDSISKGKVLDLRSFGKECDEWWRELFGQR